MKRILYILLGSLAMFLVALFTAFAAMRLAIHGREVDVPLLAGLSDEAAAGSVKKLGLNLSVENRFYSAGVAPNHVLSQAPAAGSLVRRGSQVRVTESLGGQNVSVPDVTGQTERPAVLTLRRLQLELGATAHLPAPGTPGVVLAQSPPPNSGGVFGPRVSVLIADPESEAPAQAYIMPSLIGLSISAANVKLASAGLHIGGAVDPAYVPAADPVLASDPAVQADVQAPPPVSPSAVIASQTPAPGHRVSRNETIRVTVAHPEAPAPDTP